MPRQANKIKAENQMRQGLYLVRERRKVKWQWRKNVIDAENFMKVIT
jgi:hypothetical protein